MHAFAESLLTIVKTRTNLEIQNWSKIGQLNGGIDEWLSLIHIFIVATISTSLVIAFVLCRVMNVPGKIATLVGVGSSICGGSAIAATAPVIDADDREIAQAISVIFLFNVIAALVFPTLGGMLGLTNEGFGLFAGTAINDTSSVTAAASAWDSMHPGANVLESATVVKLTRTLAIIPVSYTHLDVYKRQG